MNSLTQNISDQEQAIRTFLQDYFNKPKDGHTIHAILNGAGRHFDADRVYIVERNAKQTPSRNIYEWCRNGVAPVTNNLRDVSAEEADSWFSSLENKGEFFIPSISEFLDHDSTAYMILKSHGTESIAVAPLVVNGTVIGCFCTDNPRRNTEHMLLLSVIASACCSEISNRRLVESNNALTERMKIIQSMSEIYTSAYYIDLAKDEFKELSSMDNVHEKIGMSGKAQKKLNFFCRHMMIDEHTDELLEFTDLSTLDERLNNQKIISKQFLCVVPVPTEKNLPYWAQCSFIEGERDSQGKLTHVTFVTETIHESKTKELYAKKQLKEANKELIHLLETERQHTSIIDSLSSVFFALYYIDLETNSFREFFSSDDLHRVYSEKGNAGEYLIESMNSMVNKEYKSAMSLFTDINTLNERLGDKPIITQEYIDCYDQWVRCSFIPVEKNYEGKIIKVICGLRNISAEKEKLESLDNLIKALSMAYENVYAVNMNTAEVVCYRMGQTITARYGQKFAVGNYESNIKLYIENDVFEGDRHLFDNVRKIDSIKTLLAEKQSYSFNYRVYRNDTIQYYECQIVQPNKERNEFALGFKNVDDEKKRELAQQRKIEEALQKVNKINETLQDEMDIAGALSKDYPDVVLLDFTNDTAVPIKVNGKVIKEEKRTARHSYKALWEKFILRYVIEEDRDNMMNAVSASTVLHALKNSDEYVFSYRTIYDNTGIHYYQASFFRIFSRKASESQIIVGFRNIDAIVEEERERIKQREEQLRIIEALSREYHSLFKIDAATDKIFLYRTDGIGMDYDALNKLMEIGSYSKIISKYIDTYIVPEDRDRIKEATDLNILEKQVPDVGLYKLGYRRNMNGAIAYYEMNVVKTIDPKGMVTYIMGLRDVNDEMQRQLKQARELETQSDIIEGLGSVYYSVLLIDPRTDTVTVYREDGKDGESIANHFSKHNYRWSEGVLSYSKEHVSEKSRSEFIEKLSLDYIRTCREDYSVTYEKMTADGIIYLQARVSFVQEKNGSFVVVIGTSNVDNLIKKERQQEMALQAAYEAAEAASKAKTDFLSNMSHDIRTPMNGIIGMTAIAATHIDDKERVQDSLQKIAQASKHLLSLINEVLDMSKIESGKVDLTEEEFNLSNLVDNLLSMTSPQIKKHHHELSVNITGLIHEDVIGDSLRIQKIFTNIMSNAVKYTPDGGKISLSITEKPSHQAKIGCYEFIFEDNGIGMSEEFIDRIFEPFERANDSRIKKIHGTGLGMPISRNIVRMMGGDINVESKLNEGSRFTVTMYLKLREGSEFNYDKFINLNVLVADDDKLSLESCCDILNDFGMNADGVSTGKEAVEYVIDHHCRKRDYFACIIDWKMPDMDGIETTRAIRKAVGDEVPIIIISAYDWSDIEQTARSAGANAFISKPLFRSKLADTFNSLVSEGTSNGDEDPLASLENMDLTGHRILLVEDNDLNYEIAAEILKMTGVSVERAEDGAKAVDMISSCSDGYYDIIFMDIQMPVMNGYDATRVIRSMNRDYCRQVPIVAMTANAFAEDVQAAKTAGMNEHIAKPLDLNILARTLDRWIR
ncbi:MAG: response regulator [Ruminococcus sp.]